MTLKEIRLKSGYKQNWLCEQLGVTKATYWKYENAAYKLDKLKKEKLADIFKCSVEDIQKAWEVSKCKN